MNKIKNNAKTYLHATNKQFDKFKPSNDGLIYFSEKGNGKTKADYIKQSAFATKNNTINSHYLATQFYHHLPI